MLKSNEEINIYKKELTYIFKAICDGFKQEICLRERMIFLYPSEENENFPLKFEKERGSCSIMAFYLRQAGFFTRVENWFSKGDKNLENKTPDLDIWLPKTETDFLIEVKKLTAQKSYIESDLKRLSVAKCTNKFNGFLVFGFSNDETELKKLKNKFNEISKLTTEVYKYQAVDNDNIFPIEDISGHTIMSLIMGLWYRQKGVTVK